jgi:SAM-dependent methyltransferase
MSNLAELGGIDTSYEPFSREPEYIGANRAFIAGLELDRVRQVLDLACGTLTMTDLLLDRLVEREDQHGGEQARIFGLDLSRESLTLGRRFLADTGRRDRLERVALVEGTAVALPFPAGRFDLVMMGNAIQLVPDLEAMLREIHRVLRPGGVFAFNTSFYAGTYCPGTEHVYVRWVQESLEYVLRKDRALRAAGLPGIKRQRGTGAPAFSKPWLSSQEYQDALAAAGLNLIRVHERTVMLNQRSFETIGAYAGLARVLLSGYPVQLACEALDRAAGATLAAVGMTEVPRYWLEVAGAKPAA